MLCVQCQNYFESKKGSNGNVKYCSRKCYGKARYHRERSKIPDELKKTRRRLSYEQTKKNKERYEKHLASGRRKRSQGREWLANYKMERGCVDCGYKGHFSALQLDHEGKKSIPIADARSSIKRLQAEIEAGQCVVRCANCHSIKTWERKQQHKS